MNPYIDSLNWRYGVKKYDPAKKVSASDLEILKESVRLSASAYGLQPYEVFIIENPEIREKLRAAAYGQSQVTDASHLFVFANQTTITDQDIDNYMSNIAATRELPIEALNGLAGHMKGAVVGMPEEAKQNWTARQAYIALGNLLSAAANHNIDAGGMEGFDAKKFNEILGLDKLNLNAAVIAPVGYRHAEDEAQHQKKVRKPNQELFITL